MTGLELVSSMQRLVDRRGRGNIFSADGEPRIFLWCDNTGKAGFMIPRQMRKGKCLVGS